MKEVKVNMAACSSCCRLSCERASHEYLRAARREAVDVASASSSSEFYPRSSDVPDSSSLPS